jgi:hypothetical protein
MNEEGGTLFEKGFRSNFLPMGAPGPGWVVRWTLLTTMAIPGALFFMSPLAMSLLGISKIGVNYGLWANPDSSFLTGAGFLIGFAMLLAAAQVIMLRSIIPRAMAWFGVSAAGIVLGGLTAGIIFRLGITDNWEPFWSGTLLLMVLGLTLGLLQWLYLRRYAANAAWIVIINILAALSIQSAGRPLTSLFALLVIVPLPGLISGAGLWLLLHQSQPSDSLKRPKPTYDDKKHSPSRLALTGLFLAALVPIFFLGIWVYTLSQLALAKNEGVYLTPEDGPDN